MVDNRDILRDQLLEIINKYGSRRRLAERACTTEQYICMLFKRKRHPALSILVDLLKECGYELQIVPSPSLVRTIVFAGDLSERPVEKEKSNGSV